MATSTRSRREAPAAEPRSEQVSLRVPRATKRMLQQGAAIAGQSLTDFLVSTGAERARQLVEQHRIITLGQSAFEEFSKSLDKPARPITPLAAEILQEFSKTAREDGTFDW